MFVSKLKNFKTKLTAKKDRAIIIMPIRLVVIFACASCVALGSPLDVINLNPAETIMKIKIIPDSPNKYGKNNTIIVEGFVLIHNKLRPEFVCIAFNIIY